MELLPTEINCWVFFMGTFILYDKARQTNAEVITFCKKVQIDPFLLDQLKRASASVILNIAEGGGRITQKDRKRFFVIARGSAEECRAVFDILQDLSVISEDDADVYRSKYHELIRILTAILYKEKKSGTNH